MSSDNRPKHKDKSKVRNAKKKQKEVITSKKLETRKVKKISEKYLSDDILVENSMKLRDGNFDDDYEKRKQNEIDFFCNPFSGIKLEQAVSSEQKDDDSVRIEKDEDVSQKSEAQSERSNDSPTHLASTYIGHENEPVVAKFELERIEYDDLQLLFHPRAENIARTLNDEEKALRIHADEGIFVPDPPRVNKLSNKLLLIDRLHESGNTEFFNENGDLKNFKTLHSDDVYRLVSDKKFTPIYVPPTPMRFEFASTLVNEKKFLKIYISQILFEQHHLFSNEHQVSKIVEKLYAEHTRRKKLDIVGTLRNKLSNLRELKAQNFPMTSDGVKSARTIRNEEISLNHQIKTVRQKLHIEEKYDHMVLKSLLENWKSLKTLRSQQSYSFTSVAMKIQKFDIDVSARQAEWQQQYDAELNEMIAEEFDEYHAAKQKYKEFVRSINDPESITDTKEVMKKPRKPDIDKIVAEINEVYDEIPFDEPEVIVIMSTQEKSNKALLKPKEKVRKFKKYSYRFELEIDGEIVGSTKDCKLDEDFAILVQSAFILKLTKQLPGSIKLMVSAFSLTVNHVAN